MLIDDNRSEMMCSLCESELLTLDWGSNNNDSMTLIEADVILNKVYEEVKFSP